MSLLDLFQKRGRITAHLCQSFLQPSGGTEMKRVAEYLDLFNFMDSLGMTLDNAYDALNDWMKKQNAKDLPDPNQMELQLERQGTSRN